MPYQSTDNKRKRRNARNNSVYQLVFSFYKQEHKARGENKEKVMKDNVVVNKDTVTSFAVGFMALAALLTVELITTYVNPSAAGFKAL